MASYLVTGAGHGLALELASQSCKLSEVSIVFAATRSSPPKAFQQLIDVSARGMIHILVAIT